MLLEALLQAREVFFGRREGLVQPRPFGGHLIGGQDHGHLSEQALEQPAHPGQFLTPAPFRSVGQALVGGGLGPGVQRLEKELGVLEHARALGAVRLLVVLIQTLELARRQRSSVEVREQLLGVLGVGARQRGQYPGGGPQRQPPFAHGLQQRFGQCLEQRQAAVHPADIAAHAPGELALRVTGGELVDQCRLLDRLPGSLRAARQAAEQRLIHAGARAIRPHQVLTQLRERADAQIAVDQHRRRFGRLGDDEHGGELAAALDGAHQGHQALGIVHPKRSEAPFQAVDFQFSGRLHGTDYPPLGRAAQRRLHSCRGETSPGGSARSSARTTRPQKRHTRPEPGDCAAVGSGSFAVHNSKSPRPGDREP